jgi:hypothetical protein
MGPRKSLGLKCQMWGQGWIMHCQPVACSDLAQIYQNFVINLLGKMKGEEISM